MDNTAFRFGIEITKVDGEQRIVEGWASTSDPDQQEDVIPYAVMCDAMKASADRLGIREMHQPKAIGTLLKWWGDDESQRLGIQIFLSKSRDGEDALQKVREGVLRGFSIGGRASDWVYEGMKRVIRKLSLYEISLVDVPANPQALITLVKIQTGRHRHKSHQSTLTSPETDDFEDVEIQDDLPSNEFMAQFIEAVEKLDAIRKSDNEDRSRQIRSLEQRGEHVGILRRDGEPLSHPAGFPEDWSKYGDPANWSWPVDTQSRAQSALSYFNGGRGKSKYSPREWSILGRRIARLSSDVFDSVYEYSPQSKKVERKEKMTTDTLQIQKGIDASVLSNLRGIVSQSIDEMTKDPAHATDLLTQVLSALDVLHDHTAQTADVKEPSPRSPVTHPEEHVATTMKAATPESSLESSPESSPERPPTATFARPSETPSASIEMTKSLMSAIEKLTSAVETRFPAQSLSTPLPASAPAGDIPVIKTIAVDPVVEALTGGSIRKAISAASGDVSQVFAKADSASLEALRSLGVTSSRYYVLGS